jgi:hypothetical protein
VKTKEATYSQWNANLIPVPSGPQETVLIGMPTLVEGTSTTNFCMHIADV